MSHERAVKPPTIDDLLRELAKGDEPSEVTMLRHVLRQVLDALRELAKGDEPSEVTMLRHVLRQILDAHATTCNDGSGTVCSACAIGLSVLADAPGKERP